MSTIVLINGFVMEILYVRGSLQGSPCRSVSGDHCPDLDVAVPERLDRLKEFGDPLALDQALVWVRGTVENGAIVARRQLDGDWESMKRADHFY